MDRRENGDVTFAQAAMPVFFLVVLIVWGLILRPHFFGRSAFPLEIVFILAASFAILQQLWLGYSWDGIQASIVAKLAKATPGFFILFSVGLIISSWIVSGTIPMLVFYGLKIINPTLLYFLAFLVPVVFSMLTGTSWGSAGTVGVVIMGIAGAMGGHLGITAGAVIGGAYFGDKMSPLSDTTNMAALATDVDLYDHIRSMMYTTVPSATVASVAFFVLGFLYPPAVATADVGSVAPFLESLQAIFNFNVLLLLPPVIVLIGSLRRSPIIPTLMVSIFSAAGLGLIFQRFGLTEVMQALYKGFDVGMAPWAGEVPAGVVELLNRGGLYALIDAIVVAFTVFLFVGTLDHIRAIPKVVGRVFRFATTRTSMILSSLAATAFTNSMTSNQYATSFIVGDAFKDGYDRMNISRRVLSRSLEDYGTMLESLVPWHPTAVFMVATLGVGFADYWHWQLLSLTNLVIAPTLAILGIGCFYDRKKESDES
jgi:NhaC family Na+:H+ antiporter